MALADLETRVADQNTSWMPANADRVVLVGMYTSGGVNALMAATDPARVPHSSGSSPAPARSGRPTTRGAWGPTTTPEILLTLELWGTPDTARPASTTQVEFGNELPPGAEEYTARMSRNACTPDVAKKLSAIWYETDVRAILPAVRCPSLLLSRGEWTILRCPTLPR